MIIVAQNQKQFKKVKQILAVNNQYVIKTI